ncbi:uncharacterized protein [Littorina saxatilis]
MMFFPAMDVQTVGNTHFWIKQKYPIVLFVLVFCTQAVLCTGDCDGTFATTSGSFNSPNFPSNYNNNQDCTYLISLPRDYRVTLTFFNFSLESSGCVDYVQIFDGNSTAAPLFGKYCSRKPSLRLRTTQNEMLVRFHTDGSITSTGFKASYSSDTLGDQIIIIAGERLLQRIDFVTISSTHAVPVMLNNLRNIEFDTFDYRIYWTERRDTRIHSVLLNGSDERIVLDLGEGAVLSDIVLDAPSDLLFYIDSGHDVIGLLTTSGDAHKHIIATDLDDQTKIAVNTKTGKVYWTTRKTIEAANYDGSNITTLFSLSGIRDMVSVTVDSEHGYVYFLDTDHNNSTIQSLDSNGGQPSLLRTISQRTMTTTRVFSYDGKIFYSSINVNRTDRPSQMDSVTRGGTTHSLFYSITYTLQDAAFYKETAAHQMPTECRKNRRGVCTSNEICIPSSANDVMCLSSDLPATPTVASFSVASETPEPADANASANSVADVDNTLIILGGSLGGFAFIVTVALIIFVVIFIKRKGRSEGKPMAMDEINVRPHKNVYEPDRQPDDEVATDYDNPVCQGAVPEDDYVLPVPALPPRGNTNWSNGGDDNHDYTTLT